MTRSSSRGGAKEGIRRRSQKSKTPSASPASSSSPPEQRSRRSLRLGNAVVVDFKALSSRGRDYLAQANEAHASGQAGFVVHKSFISYDELMRFTKAYEVEKNVRLNASMITPDERPIGMHDADYYRLITFWCNFDPNVRLNTGYTSIDQRYCPFFVRVAGDSHKDCLVVQAVSDEGHRHAVDTPCPVLGAPPLPAQMKAHNLPQTPDTVAGSRRSRSEKQGGTRQKAGRVVKPQSRRNRKSRVPLASLPPDAPTNGREPASSSKKPATDAEPARSPKKPATDAEPARSPKKPATDDEPARSPKKPVSDAAAGRSVKKSVSPQKVKKNEEKCALCDFLCHSTEELVGHTWMRHQILTETWDFS